MDCLVEMLGHPPIDDHLEYQRWLVRVGCTLAEIEPAIKRFAVGEWIAQAAYDVDVRTRGYLKADNFFFYSSAIRESIRISRRTLEWGQRCEYDGDA